MDKKSIFKSRDCKVVRVDVPEWGGEIHVKEMTGSERAKLHEMTEKFKEAKRLPEIDTWCVLLSACDASGSRMFADEDFSQLNEMSATVISRIALEVLKVNCLMPDAVNEAKKN